jgi:hypothetical protein
VDDGPPTRTPTSLSRYGERHLASHGRSDIASHLGGRGDGLGGTSGHPDQTDLAPSNTASGCEENGPNVTGDGTSRSRVDRLRGAGGHTSPSWLPPGTSPRRPTCRCHGTLTSTSEAPPPRAHPSPSWLFHHSPYPASDRPPLRHPHLPNPTRKIGAGRGKALGMAGNPDTRARTRKGAPARSRRS